MRCIDCVFLIKKCTEPLNKQDTGKSCLTIPKIKRTDKILNDLSSGYILQCWGGDCNLFKPDPSDCKKEVFKHRYCPSYLELDEKTKDLNLEAGRAYREKLEELKKFEKTLNLTRWSIIVSALAVVLSAIFNGINYFDNKKTIKDEVRLEKI